MFTPLKRISFHYASVNLGNWKINYFKFEILLSDLITPTQKLICVRFVSHTIVLSDILESTGLFFFVSEVKSKNRKFGSEKKSFLENVKFTLKFTKLSNKIHANRHRFSIVHLISHIMSTKLPLMKMSTRIHFFKGCPLEDQEFTFSKGVH